MLRGTVLFLSFLVNSVFAQSLPPPINLTAKIVQSEDSRTAQIQWERNSKDSTSIGYFLFRVNAEGKKVLIAKSGVIYDSKVNYYYNSNAAGTISFCVASMVNYPELAIGECSNVFTVEFPSLWIPAPASCKRWASLLSWDYPNVVDLKGFRIQYSQDGEKVDTLISSEVRELQIGEEANNPRISAVTLTGLSSTISSFRSL